MLDRSNRRVAPATVFCLTIMAMALAGCSTLGSSGPATRVVLKAPSGDKGIPAAIQIMELTDGVAQSVMKGDRRRLFSEVFGEGAPVGTVIGQGDVVDISIWEAPPAALFGAAGGDARLEAIGTTRVTSLPEQMVDSRGEVSVPFAGQIMAAGRTPQQVERDIVTRLAQKAHLPQVIVRVVRNAAANVTVVGDVASSVRMPLTAKGERLLDSLAVAGGAKQAVTRTVIQVTRGDTVAALPLDLVIRDPQQNVRLQPDDVVTALFQPYSFTALGAVTNNAEIPFEATGLTLAQALGRVGGLQDNRADIKGIFLFRLEDPAALAGHISADARLTSNGKVPVIYRLNLQDPASFFIAQGFPIRNGDVLFVSNAPGADLQKFVSIVSSMAFSIIGISNNL